jgi:hypothetical protein
MGFFFVCSFSNILKFFKATAFALTHNLPFVAVVVLVVVAAVTLVVVMSIPIHHLLARVPNLCANAQQSKVIKWGEKNAKKSNQKG